jgi:hypothetical protein
MTVSAPLVTILAGAAIVAVAPLRERIVPVARAAGHAGAGIVTAVAAGVGGVAQAAWRGQPQPQPPRTT